MLTRLHLRARRGPESPFRRPVARGIRADGMRSRKRVRIGPALLLAACGASSPRGPVSVPAVTGDAAPPGRETSQVRVSMVANAVHQLDCLAGHIPACSRASYEALWRREGWDLKGVERWRESVASYGGSVPLPTVHNGDFPVGEEAIEIRSKIRIAAWQTGSVGEVYRALELVMAPSDALAARRVLDSVSREMVGWWSRSGKESGRVFAEDLSRLLADDQIRGLLPRIASLYGVDAERADDVQFNIVVRPESEQGSSYAEQVERHSLIEIQPGSSAEDRIDVALHEVFHYFWGLRPSQSQGALLDRLCDLNPQDCVAAFNLLNEGLATALGNGIIAKAINSTSFEERFATPLGLYNEPLVDAVAKALLPRLEPSLGTVSLDTVAFAQEYTAAFQAAVPNEDDRLRARLKTTVVVVDSEEMLAMSQVLYEHLRPGSISTGGGLMEPTAWEKLERYPRLSGLALLSPAGLSQLEGRVGLSADQIRKLAKAAARGPLVYEHARGRSASLFICVARDAETMAGLLQTFTKTTLGPGPWRVPPG